MGSKSPTFFKDDDRELARALELSRMEERHQNMAPVEVHICHRGLSPWPVIVVNESDPEPKNVRIMLEPIVGRGTTQHIAALNKNWLHDQVVHAFLLKKTAYLKPSKDLYPTTNSRILQWSLAKLP